MFSSSLATTGIFLSFASALSIPSNVQTFYNLLNSSGICSYKLASGFYNSALEGVGDMSYCGDHLEDYGVVYLQGPDKFSNMDPDCDGVQGGSQDDGRCDAGASQTQDHTSIHSLIESYDVGITDLNPYVHSYLVFGNSGDKANWPTFDPVSVGVEEASIMAVVCRNQMYFGVWGDANGDDGEYPSVGEVSISLATACYGTGINAGDGDGSSHNADDVLYIAFTGMDAVPGADGADWNATTFTDFHASLVELGNALISRIGSTGGDYGNGTTCTWEGHCAGASCSTADDCSDDLTCYEGECAVKCTWMGHCVGTSCTTADDCSDDLTCASGVCSEP